jgi:Tfp pilus assembly protein PilV
MKWLRVQRGDTLVEVVFAIAILASVLTTAYHLSTQAFGLGIDSREHTQAINVAQQQAEELRWFADQLIANGTPGGLAANIGAACGGSCSMQGTTNPTLTAGTFNCSTAVTAGCLVQISDVNDIATDTLLGSHGGLYPEIDEEITVTWPSALQGDESCIGGGNNCETASLDERLADTTNYAPIDCSVAGSPGCSTNSGGAVGSGGGGTCPVGTVGSPPNCLPQLSIISPTGSPQQFPLSAVSIVVGNTVAGSPVYLLTTGGALVDSNIATGTTDTLNETYPGGTWSVEACPTAAITTQCSGVLTITQESYTPNTPLWQYFDGNWWFYTTAPYYIEPGGTDPAYIPEGNVGYLAPAGSNQPNLIPLNREFNTITGDHYYYTTQRNPLGSGWQFEEVQGYLQPLGPQQSCAAGTTQLYQWYREGVSVGDGSGYYLSTTPTIGLAGVWSRTGIIGCIFTGP